MPPVIERFTARPDETRALGEAVASLLSAGDVVLLTGELGAGKTTFVQGATRGLGVADQVVSPTFTLVREYRGARPVYHVDVYRLSRLQEAIDLGIEDILDPSGVVFVEWGDRVESLFPGESLTVELTMSDVTDVRRIRIMGRGRSWAARWERLEGLTQAWAGSEP